MKFCVEVILVGLVALSRGDLTYDAADIDDGPCTYPQPVSLLGANPLLFSPLVATYIPYASKSLYRLEYEAINGVPAQTEDQILELKTKVQPFSLGGVLPYAAIMTVTFYGTPETYYSYQALPTLSTNPLFNVTATIVRGSSPNTVNGLGGNIVFTGVWNDNTSWLLWGCVEGRQNFHYISTTPTVTDAQWTKVKQVLSGLGFNNPTNWQQMLY